MGEQPLSLHAARVPVGRFATRELEIPRRSDARIRGESYLSAFELGDAFYAVGAAPVILDGYTIGTLVFGQRVDSALVGTLRANFDGHVVASASGRYIVGTMPKGDATALLSPALFQLAHRLRQGGVSRSPNEGAS